MGCYINKDGSVSRNASSSILETYPEYNFQPTSLNDKVGISQRLIMFFGIPVLLCGGLIGLGVSFGVVFLEEQPIGYLFLGILGVVTILFLLVLLIKWYLRVPTKSQVADYFQNKNGIVICVKDGKFGVLNNFNNHLIIPSIYDKLLWIPKDKLFRAELKGEVFLIDIYNNRLK